MKAPLLIVAFTLGLSAALVACGDAEEELTPVVTPTPTASGSSAPTATAAPTPVTGTPVTVPSGWATYSSIELGFSLAYPPDLVAPEVSPRSSASATSGPGGSSQRYVEFRSSDDPFRAIAVSVFLTASDKYTLDQFADEFYCLRDKREGSLGGVPAIRCTSEPVDDQTLDNLLVAHRGLYYVIEASPQQIAQEEFASVVESFRFLDAP